MTFVPVEDPVVALSSCGRPRDRRARARCAVLAILVGVLPLASACKKHDGGSGEAMSKMSEFRDKMCGCSDPRCARDVNADMAKWSQEQSRDGNGSPRLTDEQSKKAAEISAEMGRCLAKATAGAPGAPTGGDTLGGAAGSAGGATGQPGGTSGGMPSPSTANNPNGPAGQNGAGNTGSVGSGG